MSLKFTGLDLW